MGWWYGKREQWKGDERGWKGMKWEDKGWEGIRGDEKEVRGGMKALGMIF